MRNTIFELTPNQKIIADLLEQGFTLKEIGKKLGKTRTAIYKAVEEIRSKQQAVGTSK
jgi:DNA-binding CsgD family transcriptional regulator